MLKLITAPEEMITVEAASVFMRAEFSVSEENLIKSLITASRQMCENYLFRFIGVQTVEFRRHKFPGNNTPILLPAPVLTVTSIKYLDADNVEQTLDRSEYIVSDSAPALITPIGSWPETFRSGDSVRVLFTAGYCDPGDSPNVPEPLPDTIRIAMLLQIADMYENREAQVEKPLSANQTLVNLLAPYRLEMGI